MKINGNAIHFITARINNTVIINFHSPTFYADSQTLGWIRRWSSNCHEQMISY